MKKLILLSIYLCFFKLSAQQAGDLDTSFAQNGKGVTNISEANNVVILSQAIQNDGKIILAGRYGSGTDSKAYVKRLNTDGSTDLSFSDNGRFINNVISEVSYIKIQNDGKILISSPKKVVRIDSNGAIDNEFNPIITNNTFSGLEIQAGNKIILSTSILSPFFGAISTKIFRFSTEGLQDNSFGIDGNYSVGSELKSMLVLPNQKILTATSFANSPSTYSGYSVKMLSENGISEGTLVSEAGYYPSTLSGYFRDFWVQSDNKIIVVFSNRITRYNQDFSIDYGFGTNGIIESNYLLLAKIKTTSDGKIIALFSYLGGSTVLVRFNGNGSYDTSFNVDGVYEFPQFSYSNLSRLLNVFNNQPFVSLTSNLPNDPIQINTLYKFNPNGELESSFGDGGQKIIFENIDSNDSVIKPLIQTDGKLLLCGKNSTNNVAIVRYNIDGSIDTTYGNQGKFIYNFGSQYSLDFEIQTDDKVVILNNKSFIRVDNNGVIDNSFGVNGVQNVVISVFDYQTYFNLNDCQILPDNKIIAVGKYDGYYNNYSTKYGVLIKLNNDGSFDTNFNNSGYAIHNVYSGDSYEEFYSVAIQNDGKIIIGGQSFFYDRRNTIAKFNSDGTKDISFGTDGVFVLNDFTINTNYNYRINSMDLQTDGKIIINSLVNTGSVANSFLLGRVNPNGTLDTSFGTNGIVQTPIENSCNSNIVKVLPNQKILAIGYSTGSSTNFAMAKYNTDGSLDTSFGNQGKVTTSFLGNATASSLVLTNDNKVIVSGTAINPVFGTNDFAYAKYHLEGSLGIEENNPNNTILIFPNPAQNKITFNQEVKTVSVYTLDGKLLNTQLVNNQIDLSGFNLGIYLVRGTTNNGVSFSEKLVKN